MPRATRLIYSTGWSVHAVRGMLSSVINILFLVLAGLSFLTAIAFLLRALGTRSSAARQAYGVGQVETRRETQINLLRAVLFFLLGLIFLAVFAVVPRLAATAPEEPTAPLLPTPNTETVPTPLPTLAPVSSPTPTTEATATPPLAPATPTVMPTLTPVPAPETAVVTSGVGVWLRAAPSTNAEQLEWLLDGTVVSLMAGAETADGLDWQQVRFEESGLEGWVAREFLVFQEPTP